MKQAILFLFALFIIYTMVLLKEIVNIKSKQNDVRKKPVPIRRGIPINQRTRGETHYKRIGILYHNDIILPLYGRPTYTRSHLWNYFTISNDHVSIEIPLEIQGKDCHSSYGCTEIDDGTQVYIPAYNDTFTVKLYDRTPRYIPFVY